MLFSKFFQKKNKEFYEMNIVDLSPESKRGQDEYLFENIIVDYPTEKGLNKNSLYLGHPDSVMLDSGKLLCAYPLGHGKGETVIKESLDGGKTWSQRQQNLPSTFKDTLETPTIYKLDFCDGSQKLIMISGRPNWGKIGTGNGFDVTLSTSVDKNGKCDGKVWQPHENFFGTNAKRPQYYAKRGKWAPIVAMASLTKLKENGQFVDKWMAIFHHGYPFTVFKTILTFNEQGQMEWSYPQKFFPNNQHKKERSLQFCEPEVVRSPQGDELAILFRTNAKKSYSQVCFSSDEGNTWSAPQNLARELTGERHKAEYDPKTGKLLVTFRNIDWYKGSECKRNSWFSRGWLTWIGNYEDLKKGLDGKGDCVVKMTHTYLNGQECSQIEANGDTGYCGLTIDKDGNVVVMSYGRFAKQCEDTYIVEKRFTVSDVLKLATKKDLM